VTHRTNIALLQRPGWHRLAGLTLVLAFSALPKAFCAESAVKPRSAASKSVAEELPLAEPERVYLADIEHRALTLSKRGFPAFKTALRENDLAKVVQFFPASFQGRTLDLAKGASPASTALTVRRAAAKEQSSVDARQVSREQFASYLFGFIKRFDRDLQLEMKLLELAPVRREDLSGAWRGNANLRFYGRYPGGKPAEIFLKLGIDFARIADVDAIASDSGWIQSMRVIEGYEASADRDLFAEVGKERGIDADLLWDNWRNPVEKATIVGGGVYLADVDNDGWDDVLITDINGVFLFKRMQDGHFVEMAEKSGLPHKLHSVVNAIFGDFDQDGWPDLILDNRVFRNRGGGRFDEITRQCNLRFGSLAYLVGYTVGDFDKDGLIDIYVARSYGPKGRYGKNSWIDGPGGPGNQLWRNLGNWKFEDVSDRANARAGRRSCFTASWLDANNDSFPDLYVINEFGGGILLVNTGKGSFTEQPLIKGDLGDFGSMGLAAADINNDGYIDIYTANMYSKSGQRIVGNLAPDAYAPDVMAKMKQFFPGSELYRNLGGSRFERAGEALRVRAVGWAYGPTFFDADNDGFLDIYVTSGFASINKEEPDG